MSSSPSLPPDALLMQVLLGAHPSNCLSALARLGVADHMTAAFTPVDQLAALTGVQRDPLFRVMRLLATLGFFQQDGTAFALTPAGELLQANHPRSMRGMAVMFGDEWRTTAAQRLPDVLRTGTDGVTLAYGKHTFDLFPSIPDQAERFHQAMINFSRSVAPLMLASYDFSPFRRLADLGGGHGTMLGAMLRHHPQLHGVLFDLPEVTAGALASGNFEGCADRVTIESGSFLAQVPTGCDAYFLKHIIHDWDDDSCVRILSLMRAALPPTGRVLLLEMVVDATPAPTPAKFLDIEMLLVTPGGRERTEAEFAALFARAGLRLLRIVPTPSPMCVIEAAI